MNPARNLVLVGPTGAGKSTLGPALASRFGLRLRDLDAEIEGDAGRSIAAIFESEGEAGFRVRESDALRRVLEGSDLLVVTGGGAVLDAGNRERMRRHAFVVHLQASPAEQLARLADDRERPLLQRPDRAAVLAAMARMRDPLYADVADLAFDTGAHGRGSVAAALVRQIEALWQRNGVPA